MIITDLYLTFILACLLVELTPGPNMIYLAILSLTEGVKPALAAVAGVALGLLIIGLGAALGLAALIQQSEWIYQGLRFAGVLYLLWLGIDGFRSASVQTAEGARLHKSEGTYFRRGLITNLLNPKAGLFYIAVIPGFINPSYPATSQLFFLSLSFVVIATLVHLTIVLLAERARRLLETPYLQKRASQILSLLLIAVAIWFYFESGR